MTSRMIRRIDDDPCHCHNHNRGFTCRSLDHASWRRESPLAVRDSCCLPRPRPPLAGTSTIPISTSPMPPFEKAEGLLQLTSCDLLNDKSAKECAKSVAEALEDLSRARQEIAAAEVAQD